MTAARKRAQLLRGLLVGACLVPAAWLAFAAATDRLGANPVEEITHATGEWTLRLLVATLAVTPLRRITGIAALAPLRRSLGLSAFFYACLHVATYFSLDLGFEFGALLEDVIERPYITVGFASFLGLAVLAATSSRTSKRKLGRRWVALHRTVYAVAVGGVVHFLWSVKADLREPLVYAGVVALLLGLRAVWALWPTGTAPLWRSTTRA